MIALNLQHKDDKTLLAAIAAGMKASYSETEDFIIPGLSVGKGILKVISLAPGLQVMLADLVLYQHFFARWEPADERFYTLHFEDLYINDTFIFGVNDEKLHKKGGHSVARLTSNAFFNTEEISANTPGKMLKVIFSEAWLKKYLGLGDNVNVLHKYVSLKTASFDMEPLDAEYLRLVDELWAVKKDDPLQNIVLQNRVTLLIERFFIRLSEKLAGIEGSSLISKDEMQRLMEVERLLVKDLSESPPTINELSKLVNMSTTKLKKKFREMYGSGIYSYYQTVRLQKAKELLLSGRYNTRATAAAVGFYNPASFTTAFKKQFDMLPAAFIPRA